MITVYNKMCYRIVGIKLDMSPQSTFPVNNSNEIITFSDYLLNKHQIKVIEKNQPLFEIITGYTYSMVNNKQKKTPIPGYLIPEHCRFSAQMQELKGNYEVSNRIKIEPCQRK